MGDGPRGIEVFPDHFQASMSGADSPQSPTVSTPLRNSYDNSFRYIYYLERKFQVI